MGLKYRLSPCIWKRKEATHASVLHTSPGSQAQTVATSNGHIISAVDNALSQSLLGAIQKALGSDSPFWHEHGYPTPSFFSYFVDISEPRTDAGSASAMQQSTPVYSNSSKDLITEIALALLPHVCRVYSKAASDFGGVEWYVWMILADILMCTMFVDPVPL